MERTLTTNTEDGAQCATSERPPFSSQEGSHALLSAIVESSDDAIISKDLDGVITSWNRAAERIFGYSAREAIGQSMTMLIPADRLLEETYVSERIRHGERVEHFETVRRRKNGTMVQISMTVSPVRGANGRILGASKIARDITAQRQAQAELKQSEQRFQVTLASIGDGVIATDKEGRVTFMNGVAESLTGWNSQQAKGLPLELVFKIVDEWTRRPSENAARRAVTTGRAVELGNHSILLAKDGKELPIDDSAAPIRGHSGELGGVVLVFRDATKQRAAEEIGRRLAAFVENSEDAIFGTDLEGVIQAWNSGAERIFGYGKSQILGRPLSETIIPPEQRDEEAQVIERLRRGERLGHYETVRLRQDGKKVDVSVMVAGVRDSASQQLIGISQVVRDITEQKRLAKAEQESGERYRALFNSMDEGFCVLQMIFDESDRPIDYRLLEINPAFEKQTGIQHGLGRRMREIAPEHENHWFEIYGEVAKSGSPVRFENRAEALNRWFDVYAYRVGPAEERKVALLFNDITKRKLAEQALARAKEELEAHARSLESLVSERTARLQTTIAELEGVSYSLSHDMRAPLRTIQSFSQIVLDEAGEKLGEEEVDLLRKTISAAARLDRLIQDVLIYSRVAREKIQLRTLDVGQLLRQIIEERPDFQPPRAVIEIQLPLEPVRGHEAYLTQCVTNLLDNSVKFIPPGRKPHVKIWNEVQNNQVKLWFEDNGIGIPKEAQERVFGMFERVHGERVYPGTGIGLTIVRKAVERMGGSMGVQSELGHGSRFWLQLPRGEA